MKRLKGLTGLGQWVTWDPRRQTVVVREGGSLIFENGRVIEHRARNYPVQDGFLDVRGRLITPGLVDAHTHPAFAETRAEEFEMRCQGKSYQEIAAAGGGIQNSARKLRELDEQTLTERVRRRLLLFLAHGTTTVECKSGYGLTPESELKSLQAIRQAGKNLPLRIATTFLGAHAIPQEYANRREEYIALLTERMIPEVATKKLAEFCDVFCEKGYFTPAETRTILTAAKKWGLKPKIHADEFVSTGGTELGVELGAVSVDHLMAVSPAGIKALVGSDTTAVLLPGTTFFLGQQQYAPARKLLEAGVKVALATDFNPGSSMTVSLPFIMTLAMLYLKMKPLEVLEAVTINGARAIDRHHEVGALAPGYFADAVIWNCRSLVHVPYFYAVNQVAAVIHNGRLALGSEG